MVKLLGKSPNFAWCTPGAADAAQLTRRTWLLRLGLDATCDPRHNPEDSLRLIKTNMTKLGATKAPEDLRLDHVRLRRLCPKVIAPKPTRLMKEFCCPRNTCPTSF